jgi:hypothetical protein
LVRRPEIRQDGVIAVAQELVEPGQVRDDPETSAIRRTALDYIEGWYDGDAARMESSLHPQLAKRLVEHTPDGDRLDEMSAMRLVQMTRHEPRETRRTDVTILNRFENAASVRVDAHAWIDYIHMAKWNGRWVIVNVLWELRPGVRRG